MSLKQADKIAQSPGGEDTKAWEVHWVPIFSRFAVDLVKMAKVGPGQLVLDVGTWTGIAAFQAAKATIGKRFDRN